MANNNFLAQVGDTAVGGTGGGNNKQPYPSNDPSGAGGQWASGIGGLSSPTPIANNNLVSPGGISNVNTAAIQAPNASAYQDHMSDQIQGQIAANRSGVGLNFNPNASGTSIAPLMMLGNGGAQISTGADNNWSNQQQTAINNLSNIANGVGPNAATIAAQQQGQQSLAAQMAAAASSGGNPALAARVAANAASTTNQNIAANAVQGSAAEQMQAEGELQGALGQARSQGQAIPLAQAQLAQSAMQGNQQVQAQGALSQAQLNQQLKIQNIQAQLQKGTISTQQANAMINAEMQQNSYDITQGEQYQNALQGFQSNQEALASGQAIANQQYSGQLLGSGFGAVGAGSTALATSDKRAKKEIKTPHKDINKFLTAFAGIKVNKYTHFYSYA